jgi:uncharacterized protein YbcI
MMKSSSDLGEKKRAIGSLVGAFFEEEFCFSSPHIKVLIDQDLLLIRVKNFLAPAEIEIGKEKRERNSIYEMYSKLYDKVKFSLINRVNQITCETVISSQIDVNLETRTCLIILYLSSNLSNNA